MQFDLNYDRAALEVTAAAGPAAEAAGKRVLYDAGSRRVLIMGANRNSIGDGIVVKLNVRVKESGKGTYPLRITGAGVSAPQGAKRPCAARNGSVKVVRGSAS